MRFLGNIQMHGGSVDSAVLESCSVKTTPSADNDIANKKYVDDQWSGFYSAPRVIITRAAPDAISYIKLIHPFASASDVEFVLMYKTRRSSDNRNNLYGWSGTKKGWTVAKNNRRMRLAYNEEPYVFKFTPSSTSMMSLEEYIAKYYTYPISMPEYDEDGNPVKVGMMSDTANMDRSNLAFNWSGGKWENKQPKLSRVFGIACRRKVYIESETESDEDAKTWVWEYSNVAKIRATINKNAALNKYTLHFSPM